MTHLRVLSVVKPIPILKKTHKVIATLSTLEILLNALSDIKSQYQCPIRCWKTIHIEKLLQGPERLLLLQYASTVHALEYGILCGLFCFGH